MQLSVPFTDLTRHMYLIGASGSGKTTLERNLAKYVETANRDGTFRGAFIYIDVKGDDARKFVAQYGTLDPEVLTYLDPVETSFSVNPLELPSPKNAEERGRLVSVYTGNMIELINQWYVTSNKPFQTERIFRALLYYVYQLSDTPTFRDLHDLVLRIMDGDQQLLADMGEHLSPLELAGLRRELESIANMKEDAFVPVLTRLAEFAVDPYLQKLFSVRKSTVDFCKLVSPGHQTIARISPHSVGAHIAPLIQAVILLKVWFTVLERAETVKNESMRTPVIIVLDEFQDIQHLQAIDQILSQARSKGLGLVLSHQTTAQLPPDKLALIMGNCATQGSGRVNGEDARRLAATWDPQFRDEITRTLPTQPDFRWVFRTRAQPGEEQQPPFQVQISPPPKEMQSDEEVEAFIQKMKELYGTGVLEKSLFETEEEGHGAWEEYSTVLPIPKADAWKILVALIPGPAGISEIGRRSSIDRTSPLTKETLDALYTDGLISIISTNRRGDKTWGLTEKAKNILPPGDLKGYESIGGSDAQEIAQKACDYYLSHGCFFTLGRQDLSMKRKPDCVVYEYARQVPVCVEVESADHVATHADQLALHFREIDPFRELHVWIRPESKAKVDEILQSVPADLRSRVKVFV